MTLARVAGTLLALDTTGQACSAAIWRRGDVVASCLEPMARGQSERLVPMVEDTMRSAGVSYAELDAVAVTLGPGGFTGVRIGLAAAQGFALAWGLPVLGVTSFAAVAEEHRATWPHARRFFVVLDSKRDDYFIQAFDAQLMPHGEPGAVQSDDLTDALPDVPLFLAGDGAARAAAQLKGHRDLELVAGPAEIKATAVARYAATLPLPTGRPAPPEPLYLRAPDVTLPSRR